MNYEIDPDEAIKQIIALSNQIDPLLNMTYSNGGRVKTQLMRRIKIFVQATFMDYDKKIRTFESDLKHIRINGMSAEMYQRQYIDDLETMRDYLIAFKEELELFSNSRKKNHQTSSSMQNKNQTRSRNNSIINPDTAIVHYNAAIPISSSDADYIIDQKGDIGTRLKKSRRVFVVHGHNETIKDDVSSYLKSLKLEPIILHEQANRGKTIIEKFEHYSNVVFAVILLTQDDLGCTLGPLQVIRTQESTGLFSKKEPEIRKGRMWGKQNPRARQNVIFEFGYFIGKIGRNRVAALCEDGIEHPSDIEGLIYIALDSQGTWRDALKKEIESAGIETELKK